MSATEQSVTWAALAREVDLSANVLIDGSDAPRHRFRVLLDPPGDDDVITMRAAEPLPALTRGATISFEVTKRDALYQGTAELLAVLPGRGTTQAHPALQLRVTQRLRRRQRRALFRVGLGLPFRFVPEGVAAADAHGRVIAERGLPAELIDLSGGGLQFRTRYQQTTGSELHVSLSAPGLQLVEPVTVVRVELGLDAGRLEHRIGAAFSGISRRRREQLIRYLFQASARDRDPPR